MMKAKVLVSACLLGSKVRYDGSGAEAVREVLRQWEADGRLVPVCPEVAGGLGIPRPPAEIVGGTGQDVLDGEAAVRTASDDVSDAFVRGAQIALELARKHDIAVAVLKERSPSCGAGAIYDGTYSKTLIVGDGVTTALLQRNGVTVFGESELEAANALLRSLDREQVLP